MRWKKKTNWSYDNNAITIKKITSFTGYTRSSESHSSSAFAFSVGKTLLNRHVAFWLVWLQAQLFRNKQKKWFENEKLNSPIHSNSNLIFACNSKENHHFRITIAINHTIRTRAVYLWSNELANRPPSASIMKIKISKYNLITINTIYVWSVQHHTWANLLYSVSSVRCWCV